jgi:hypothetical protein
LNITSNKQPWATKADTTSVALLQLKEWVGVEKAKVRRKRVGIAAVSAALGIALGTAGFLGYDSYKGSKPHPAPASIAQESPEVPKLKSEITGLNVAISGLEARLSSATAVMAANAYDPTVEYDVQYDYGKKASKFYINTTARKKGAVVDLTGKDTEYNLAQAGARVNLYNRLKKLGLTDLLTEEERKGFLEYSGIDISIYGKQFLIKNDERKLVAGDNGALVPEGNYNPKIRKAGEISPAQLNELRKPYKGSRYAN